MQTKRMDAWKEKAASGKYEPMSENEFLLEDRLTKIKSIIKKYGKDNFYISFSGGKDSVVLSELVSMALGDEDDIPRVYADTGLDLRLMREFVYSLAEKDDRYFIIKPHIPVGLTLREKGYPFKSKRHSRHLERYQRGGMMDSVNSYLGNGNWGPKQCCPEMLKYQFTDSFKLKVSDKCCEEMKEKPLKEWGDANGRPYTMIGIMPEEGGRREHAVCLAFKDKDQKKLSHFQPLVAVNKAWEEWFIKEYGIEICDIYKKPYNFSRSSCKGCPFSRNLQKELDTLAIYFPEEYRQCQILWEPVYKEYKRINYRLRKEVPGQISLFDLAS